MDFGEVALDLKELVILPFFLQLDLVVLPPLPNEEDFVEDFCIGGPADFKVAAVETGFYFY